MIIAIKGTQIELVPSLKKYIETKLHPLGRFLTRYETKGEIQMFVEIAKTTHHHKKGNVFYAEATAELPHYGLLRAEVFDANMYAAIDKLKDILKREIEVYKEKYLSKKRKLIE